MAFTVPDNWQSPVKEILSTPGVTVVVGSVDVGKTSLCTYLANRALDAGIPTAIVDGDMGQSEIGPPTTVGVGLVDSPINVTSDLKPKSLYFVGTTSPVGHLLSSAVGVKRMVEKAQALGREFIIVDTTGLISGVMGRKLKTHKIELLRPRHIIAVQKSGEAEHFLRFFDSWEDCTIHRLAPSPAVRPKTQAFRTQRRMVRFHEYFAHGQVHDISLAEVMTSGTWLRTGRPLEPRYMRFAEQSLGIPVFHGEFTDRTIFLVTGGLDTVEVKKRLGELQEEFRTKSIVIVPASRYAHLVTGLLDSHLDLLSLGIVKGIDFRSQTISVFTPLRSIAPVKSIRLGVLRLRQDGSEIGRLRPGDV